jgi:hypothetical protein
VIGFTMREVDFSSIQSRFDSLGQELRECARGERAVTPSRRYAAASTMLGDHWQRGIGSGGFRYLFPEYIKKHPDVYAGGRSFGNTPTTIGCRSPLSLEQRGRCSCYWVPVGGCLVFYRSRAIWHSLAIPVLIGCTQTLAHAWFDFPFQNPGHSLHLVGSDSHFCPLDRTRRPLGCRWFVEALMSFASQSSRFLPVF